MFSEISHTTKNVGLIAISCILAFIFYLANPTNIDHQANIVLSIGLIMIFLWVSDALPMPVVAILPLILFPLLGISTLAETSKSYSNPVIFLFLGGFMLGLAIEKWQLHTRIALNIIKKTGTGGDRIVLGFILATGLLSMWLSNTATTMMMYPIALSVIAVISQHRQEGANYAYFNLTIMLSIAYASNIGGIATIIGTPPNVAYIGYLQSKYGSEVDFMKWMLLCAPIALILLISLYWVMAKWLYPSNIKANTLSKSLMLQKVADLGKMTTPEKRVLVIFCITAALWIFRSLINSCQSLLKLDDTIIALFAALLLFIVPSGNQNKSDEETAILVWSDTSRMAWGILLLFGGGICLAEALEKVGLIELIGAWLTGNTPNLFLLILFIAVISIFISEVMSNVAQVIVFAPVVSSMADAMNINPLLLGIPMTLAASCAGMLPMGTPPNAIVFASNHIQMKDMIKVGLVMNLISIGLITIFVYYLVPVLF